jgi:pimeloyl-ACP methyl ester carboxylesterase
MHRNALLRLQVPTFAPRAILGAVLLSIGTAVRAAPPPAPAIADDQRLLPYAEPGQLVDIGGRHINLRCTGNGRPPVILMAGLASWSFTWYKTQPEIATKTRACAFDRANFGFSDSAPQPQILSGVVTDLHAVLQAANIPGPYVLVGKSFGGMEARVFAQRWPREVAGMVLVDSSYAAQSLAEANMPSNNESGPEGNTVEKLKCAAAAAHGPLSPSSPLFSTFFMALIMSFTSSNAFLRFIFADSVAFTKSSRFGPRSALNDLLFSKWDISL